MKTHMPFRKSSIFLFLFLFFYSTLFHSGHLFPQDDELRYRLSESLILRQDFAIEPVRGFGTKTGLDGREYTQYAPGLSIIAAPLYLVGHITYPLVPEALTEVYRHDTMRFHSPELREFWIRHWVSMLNHVIFGLIGVMLYLLGVKITGNVLRSALMSTIFVLTSFILPYSRTFFSEPAVSFLFLWVFYLSLSPLSWKTSILMGIATGLALLIRQDSILWAFLFLLFLLKNAGLREWKKAGLATGIITLFGLFILYLNYRHFGNPFTTGYEAQKEGIAFSAPLLVSFYGFLFSTGRSIFLYSPVLIPALLALPFLKKIFVRRQQHYYFLISTVIVYFLFYSAWQNWAGGWDWGPRHIYICVPLLGVAFMTYPLDAMKRKILLLVTVLSGMIIQILGSFASFIDYHTYFLQSYKNLLPPEFYRSIFVPDVSALAGHWWLIRNGYIDLWWYQLCTAPDLPLFRFFFPFLNIVLVIIFLLFTARNLYILESHHQDPE